jgi:hypothetical protein
MEGLSRLSMYPDYDFKKEMLSYLIGGDYLMIMFISRQFP